MDRSLGSYKALIMLTDGTVKVTDRMQLGPIQRRIRDCADDILIVHVTRIAREYQGPGKPEVWEIVPASELLLAGAVEPVEPDPTLEEQRDACRATAAELLASPGRDCNAVTQALHWNRRADQLQARIDAGEK